MKFALNYAENEEKVVEDRRRRILLSGHNCNDKNAIYEFSNLENNHHKKIYTKCGRKRQGSEQKAV